MTWNLGSVAATVLDLVENVPTSISGTRMLEMADRNRNYIEEYTGQSIGSVNIDLKFQNALVYLTARDTLKTMILVGADVSSFSLGELSVSKGKGSNLDDASERFDKAAKEELRNMGKSTKTYQAYYG